MDSIPPQLPPRRRGTPPATPPGKPTGRPPARRPESPERGRAAERSQRGSEDSVSTSGSPIRFASPSVERPESPISASREADDRVSAYMEVIKGDLTCIRRDTHGYPRIATTIIDLGHYLSDLRGELHPDTIGELNTLVWELINNPYYTTGGETSKLWAVHVDAIWLAHEMRKKEIDDPQTDTLTSKWLTIPTERNVKDIARNRLPSTTNQKLKNNFDAILKLWQPRISPIEMQSLREENQRLREQSERQHTQNNQMSLDNQNLTTRLAEQARLFNQQSLQLEELRRQNEAFGAERQKMQTDAEALRLQKETEFQEALQKASQEKERLRQQMQQLERSEQERKTLQNQITELETRNQEKESKFKQELETKDKQFKELKTALENLEKTNQNLNKSQEEFTNQNRKLKAAFESLTQNSNEQKSLIEKKEEENAELRKTINKSEEQTELLTKKINGIDQYNKDLQQQLQTLQATLKNQQETDSKQINEQKNKISILTQDLIQRESQIHENNKEKERNQKSIQKQEQENAQLQKQVSDAEHKIEDSNKEINALKAQNEKLLKKLETFDQVQRELAAQKIKEAQNKLEAAKKELQKKVDQFKQFIPTWEVQIKENASLQSQFTPFEARHFNNKEKNALHSIIIQANEFLQKIGPIDNIDNPGTVDTLNIRANEILTKGASAFESLTKVNSDLQSSLAQLKTQKEEELKRQTQLEKEKKAKLFEQNKKDMYNKLQALSQLYTQYVSSLVNPIQQLGITNLLPGMWKEVEDINTGIFNKINTVNPDELDKEIDKLLNESTAANKRLSILAGNIQKEFDRINTEIADKKLILQKELENLQRKINEKISTLNQLQKIKDLNSFPEWNDVNSINEKYKNFNQLPLDQQIEKMEEFRNILQEFDRLLITIQTKAEPILKAKKLQDQAKQLENQAKTLKGLNATLAKNKELRSNLLKLKAVNDTYQKLSEQFRHPELIIPKHLIQAQQKFLDQASNYTKQLVEENPSDWDQRELNALQESITQLEALTNSEKIANPTDLGHFLRSDKKVNERNQVLQKQIDESKRIQTFLKEIKALLDKDIMNIQVAINTQLELPKTQAKFDDLAQQYSLLSKEIAQSLKIAAS